MRSTLARVCLVAASFARSLAPLGGVPVSKTDIMSSGSRAAAAAEEAKRERGSFQCAITIITGCKYNTYDPTLTDGDSHSCLIAQDGPEGRTEGRGEGGRAGGTQNGLTKLLGSTKRTCRFVKGI